VIESDALIIAIEVQCMNADYVVWGGESGGPVDDFFNGRWASPTERGKIFGGIGQRSVTYRKNVAPRCGCSVPAAEWSDLSAVGHCAASARRVRVDSPP